MKREIINNSEEIARKIEQAGGRLYLVGGALRDEMLGREIHDKDYCVVGLTADSFKKLFPEAFLRGKSFEVFDLYGNEFAMARTEKKNGTGHKSFEIHTNPNITIEEDLSRRDITINAIAKDVLTGEIIDPYNGKKDLENRIIRATTERFVEDPLRVYRVARFSATFEFEVEKSTIELIKHLKKELTELSAERVFIELKKALDARKPSIFFDVLRQGEVLDVHFKEINDLIDALQPEKYHPEGDAYNHTMIALDKCAEMTDDEQTRFATLVHDLGKGITPKSEYPHHYGHDKNGVKLVGNFGKRLKMPASWIKCGKTACREHMIGGIFNQMRLGKKVDFLERVSKSVLGLHGLQIVVNADKMRFEDCKLEDINFENVGNECLNRITGKCIEQKYNLKPGIEFGKKLREERIKFLKNK